MFEMLTGRTPFQGSIQSILGQIIGSEPPRPSELRSELDPELEGDTRRFALASLWRDLSPVLRTLDRQVEMVDLAGQRERLEPTVRELEPFYTRAE